MYSPRIYLYKITFEEVPYYYYGVHKEKKFDEYYMGSPITNKWCWEFYTPKKQILEVFEFSEEPYEYDEDEDYLDEDIFEDDDDLEVGPGPGRARAGGAGVPRAPPRRGGAR